MLFKLATSPTTPKQASCNIRADMVFLVDEEILFDDNQVGKEALTIYLTDALDEIEVSSTGSHVI